MENLLYKKLNSDASGSSEDSQSDKLIRRLAFTSSIELGSLYDIRTDSVVTKISTSKDYLFRPKYKRAVYCNIRKSKPSQVDELLEEIGIDHDMWLRVTVGIISAKQVLSLIDSDVTLNESTRILHYCYLSEERILNYQDEKTKQFIEASISDKECTHIVTAVQSGTHVVAVLEITTNDDDGADKILKQFSDNIMKKITTTIEDDKVQLDSIVVKNVFSNVADIRQTKSLFDLYKKLIQQRSENVTQSPFQFFLRPIEQIGLSKTNSMPRYIALSESVMARVRGYVWSLWTCMKQLYSCIDDKVEKLLKRYLKNQLEPLGHEVSNFREEYELKIDHVRKLLSSYYSGNIKKKDLVENLSGVEELDLKERISQCIPKLEKLKDKAKLINELRDQYVDYVPVKDSETQQSNDLEVILQKLLGTERKFAVFCSTDELTVKYEAVWKRKFHEWVERLQQTQSADFVFVDFTYQTSFVLKKVQILLINEQCDANKQSNMSKGPGSESQAPTMCLSENRNSTNVNDSSNPSTNKKERLNNNRKDPESGKSNLSTNSKTSTKTSSPNIDVKTESQSSKESYSSNSTNFKEGERSSATYTDEDIPQVSNVEPAMTPREKRRQQRSKGAKMGNAEIEDSKPETNQHDSTSPVAEQCARIEKERRNNSSPIDPTRPKRARIDSNHDAVESSVVNDINVLLLGESGVGKSTFINAIVNYHRFETFKQASRGQPLVVMPISFLLTVGDDFEEKIVRFGGKDPNEDYDHPGQSVTQHCRSYVFPLNDTTNLRLIDTPGMGDTRGIDQDDRNLNHIISYISKLPHLNAICILLKPNESKLSIVLRSYFENLLSFMGERACHNIVFCFTNTRSTFYGPGDTAPQLRKMIESVSIRNIPFEKSNTFCFDSESFRYLTALRAGIKFEEFEQAEYKQSWTNSAKESDRLLQYLCGEKLKPLMESEWRSLEHARSKIKDLIRPMMEALRNIIRNIILLEKTSTSSFSSIKLTPVSVPYKSGICSSCARKSIRVGNFTIFRDDVHNLSDKCQQCDCSLQKHRIVSYKLKYKVETDTVDPDYLSVMQKAEKQLTRAIIELTVFYDNPHISGRTRYNPIYSELKTMIEEESPLSSQDDTQCYNRQLYDQLIKIKEKCREALYEQNLVQQCIYLSRIYRIIESVSKMDQVKDQLLLIKKERDLFIEKYEKKLSPLDY